MKPLSAFLVAALIIGCGGAGGGSTGSGTGSGGSATSGSGGSSTTGGSSNPFLGSYSGSYRLRFSSPGWHDVDSGNGVAQIVAGSGSSASGTISYTSGGIAQALIALTNAGQTSGTHYIHTAGGGTAPVTISSGSTTFNTLGQIVVDYYYPSSTGNQFHVIFTAARL